MFSDTGIPMIINEWQLGTRLNQAVNTEQRSDFSLWLSFLSPAVEEMAAFTTPDATQPEIPDIGLEQQFSVIPKRSFDTSDSDIAVMYKQGKALIESGKSQMKLAVYLQEPPLVLNDNKDKIASDVWQNTSLHYRRRVQQPDAIAKQSANPELLYDILQQLHQ